jgi:RND family efflux transporter MFP subunit
VAIGQPVARLAHKGEKEAVVSLPETWLGEARNAKASVRLWSDRDRKFQARLRELSPQADQATRTFAARFTILDADDSVAFGMTATVVLEREREAPVARVPLAAVLNRGTGPTVYVVDNNDALVQRPVTVASFTGDDALITGGVNNGERVVTLGVQTLEAGLRVRTIEARP